MDEQASMPDDSGSPRNPNLLDRARSLLLVVDVQQKLMPLIDQAERIAWNIGRLADGAALLEVPAAISEQYPAGLGTTIPDIARRIHHPAVKTMFSCRQCRFVLEPFLQSGRTQLVVAGIESHVCVLQSALDMVTLGFDVFVVADAVGSRYPLDHQIALRRMESAGINLVTTESVLFEWCEQSDIPQFRAISLLIKKPGPSVI